MASRIHWSDLKVGLIAFCAIVALAVSILLFARVGALHGDTETIYITAPDASGVLAGTDVRLVGQKVGLVKAIRFRRVDSDTLQRLAIEIEVLADRMHLIRKNAWADIRPGGNLIGSPVIYIGGGTADARAVRNGDTLASRISSRMAVVGNQIDTLTALVTAAAESAGKVIDLLSDPSTSVGAFRTRGLRELTSVRAITSNMMDRATSGAGTLGLANRGRVGERIARVLAEKDSIKLLVSSPRGNVGRFRRDSTLLRQVARVRAEVDSIRALVSARGSGVARLRSDTTLKREIARARAELDSLMGDIKKHPLRYISF